MQPHPSRVPPRWTVLLLLTGCAFQSGAGERSSNFLNESEDAIRSVQVRQHDADRWTEVDLGDGIARGKLRRLHLRTEGRGRCLYDVKTTFDQGPALLHLQMDLCAVSTYSPERYRRFGIRQATHSKSLPRTTPPATFAGAPTYPE